MRRRPRYPIAAAPLALLFCASALLSSSPARSAGMFFTARGARPLGRAAAYVAGADDLEALYYNPAGLAGTGHRSLLLDVGLVFQDVTYERIDAGGNLRPPVSSDNAFLPVPMLGISWRPDSEKLGRRLTLGFGLWAPYSTISRYPETGPQRFSLVSLEGTAILIADFAAALRVTTQFYLGIGLQLGFARVGNRVVLSACTELNCAPEDPGFDALTQATVTAPVVPSANIGMLYLMPKWRIGASFQLPYFVRASGTVKTRLPSDPQFDGATVHGDAIDVALNLPFVARAGVEARPLRELRIEVSLDYEAWWMQDQLTFEPRGVYLDNVKGIGRYDLKPMALDRSMQGVFGASLGGEYDLWSRRITLRAGYRFETNSVPDETLSVLTPDGTKHLVTVGASIRIAKVRLDIGYGHVFQADRTVTTSRSLQLNPIQPSLAVPVGNGTYRVATNVLSLGLEARF